MTFTRPPEAESARSDQAQAPDAGVIEDARARQRRHRGIAFAATIAAAAIVGIGLTFVGGGRGPHRQAGSGHPTPSLVAARFRNVSGAPCVWHPTTGGTPSRSLLSILGVFRSTTARVRPLGEIVQRLSDPLGDEVYANYVRLAGVFAGSPTYLYVEDATGCSTTSLRPTNERRWLGDNVAIFRPGVHELGAVFGGAAAIEGAQWVWLGGPGIKGLASTSETVTLLVPDHVASVTIRYPTEAVEPAYHKHPGPIVPALTINATPINNLVTFTVHHHASGAIGPVIMIWRAKNGGIIKTFKKL
jgi:hypothetical protein